MPPLANPSVSPPLHAVWRRIRLHQGEPFQISGGSRFIYRVDGTTLLIENIGYGIARSNFERALQMPSSVGPAELAASIRGPAYVWAILHDARIRDPDW
jgi:hypothetical protein